MKPGATLDVQRGDAVVCIPVYGGHEDFVACLRSVLAHTDATVPILVCDDASPDERTFAFVRGLEQTESEHVVHYLRQERNLGFPGNVNIAFAAAAPADVAVVNSDCVVAAEWLSGLRAAAYSDSRVATATALTNHGTIVSVPRRGRPDPRLPEGWSLDDAAAAVRAGSLRLRPRLPTAIGHCLYVRRSALELVGEFDLAFTPGYGEEVDFAQRCLQSGLSHILADDVFVFHRGGASFSVNGAANPIQARHERLIADRYPYYHAAVEAVEEDVAGPLARALSAARRSLGGLSVMIDARVVAGPMTGTQLQVLEVISALARAGTVRLSVVVNDEISPYARAHLARFSEIRLLTRRELSDNAFERADLVHRPYQINYDEDLTFLAGLGERLMVTNQDLIGYHNPAYFRTFAQWQGYRRITRSALAVADHVVFLSAHARDDALAEDLLEADRASVVHNGVDHTVADGSSEPVPPVAAAALPADAEAILCLGTDFRHKNRLFALRLLAALRERGWPGYLLLAGPHVTEGSSRSEERELIARTPGLAGAVIDLAAVSEAEKVWLFRRARLVLYPTVHEGFGLVPFESADHDVPCLWAATTSLAEVLPPDAGEIVMWNAEATAERALALLHDDSARASKLEAIRAAASGLTWDAAAGRLTELYHLTCARPATPASSVERRHGIASVGLSEDAMRLVGPGGALPADVERPLLALATHPHIGSPMFRVMKLGYRASFALRRRRR
jgi:GT2 family glycosyltransferase/glycosyltransferase involved in cell wall biosynthesis